MAGGMAVLLLHGKWILTEYRVWIFQASNSHGLNLSSRTRFVELVDMVERKLGVDRRTQAVNLSYQWPSFMLMEDGKDAPPVPIRTDSDLDCFLSIRGEVPLLNICAAIIELSPNCHEGVDSNNITTTNWSGGDVFEETMGTVEVNEGAIVVYEGVHNHVDSGQAIRRVVPKSNTDKGKEKLVETEEVQMSLGFDMGEPSNGRGGLDNASFQMIYEELVRVCNEKYRAQPQDLPHNETIVAMEDDNIDVSSSDGEAVMGSAEGVVERLIAEEFDPIEQLVWGIPMDPPIEEELPNGGCGDGLCVGRNFKDKAEFKVRVALNALQEKYTFKTVRSSPKYIDLVCVNVECPWRVFSSIIDGTNEFQVRTSSLLHTCSVDDRRHYHKHATVDVLAELMMPRFVGGRRGPPPVEIQRLIHVEHQVRISYWKAWKCREIALEKAAGSISGSYALLPSYLANLTAKNPGSICKLECDDDFAGGKRFKYLFISYGASIRGLPFLRRVILMDGTHLRGRYGGCLIIASGQDGNLQTFPIAYAVVDSENDASYEWFLNCLTSVCGDQLGLVFISDRHPSIIKGLEKIYPLSTHGACLVHLTRNVATKFSREKRLPGLVIRAGKAYTPDECSAALAEIEAISPACGNYLREVGVTRWTRAYFNGNRYNIMTTNLAESLNNVLKECRELPIVAMLEAIRLSLQGWFNERRYGATTDTHSLPPRIRAMLEPIFDESHFMKILKINEWEYELHDRAGGKFWVNLKEKKCSCMFWDKEMIPCPHAMAAGHKENIMADSLILEKYYTGYVQHTWAESIYPFEAPVATDPRVFPPWTRRPPGRPKKRRLKSRVEMKRRSKKLNSCSRCFGTGHNKATCKSPIVDTPKE